MLILSILLFLYLTANVEAQSVQCDCAREFAGDRLDLVKAPGNQRDPVGDADPVTGNYFLLWHSTEAPTPGQPEITSRVVGRIYSKTGKPLFTEFSYERFPVNGPALGFPAAVVYNSRSGGFLIAWVVYFYNSASNTYDRVELRGMIISSNGTILSPTKRLMRLPLRNRIHQILYNRFINGYVVLYSKHSLHNRDTLYVQRLNSSNAAFGSPIQIIPSASQIDNAQIRLDPVRNRYAVAWSYSNELDKRNIRSQILGPMLQKIGPAQLVAEAAIYSPPSLVYSGKRKAFVIFWSDRKTSFARVIRSDGNFGSDAVTLTVSGSFTAVRTNPQDDGFVILRGSTPKVTRLDENFNVMERAIYPSCQSGDRNNPDLLIYNPAAKEFLVVWVYAYWVVDGGMEIHGRRLKAVPTGASCN